MCLAQGPQRSDAGEAQTCGPLVWSQALYHRATALPLNFQVLNTSSKIQVMNHYVAANSSFVSQIL